ncbi:MAG TPA: hypothetical protein VK850_12925 [Candidatus Binatia bacterium]|nr:hypothetical protein [Candidatus Binatia bacterium]
MIAARKIDLISPEEYLAAELDSPVKREYVKAELPLSEIYEGVEFVPEPEEEL